ncbi:energy transducer TonB [Marinicella marina]|nr:energy transducer TonB [Marinicella marina]
MINRYIQFLLIFNFCEFPFKSIKASENVLLNREVEVIHAPTLKFPTIPMYKATEGWAKIGFTITEDGNTTDFQIIDSYPLDIFAGAAIETLRDFKFSPKLKDGKPIAQRVNQVLEFKLPESVPVLGKKLLGLMVAVDVASKATGVLQNETLKLPDDVTILIKSIKTESSIKTHRESLRELDITIYPDENGRPFEGSVTNNTIGDVMSEVNVNEVIESVIYRAQYIYDNFSGYYNPVFKLRIAKNQPAEVIPTYVAKSKAIPYLSIDFVFTSKLKIESQGIVTNISNPMIDGEPINPVLARAMIDSFHFFSARKRFKSVNDDINFTVVFSLVQKYDI